MSISEDEEALAGAVAEALASVLAAPGSHHVVLTGGGVGTRVLGELADRGAAIRPVPSGLSRRGGARRTSRLRWFGRCAKAV